MTTRGEMYCYFRLGLVTGLVELHEVTAWADAQLIESPEPDFDLVELSMAQRWPHSKMIYLLYHLQGWPDMDRPVALLLERAAERLHQNPAGAYDIAMGVRLLDAEPRLAKPLRLKLQELEKDLDRYRARELSTDGLRQRLEDVIG